MIAGWQYTPYIIPLLIAAFISAILAVYAWRYKTTSGATLFLLLMLGVTVWSFSYALELSATNLSVKIFWGKVQYFGIVTIPLAWFGFALHFTNRENHLTRRNILLATIIPLTTLLLIWRTERHGLIWQVITIDEVNPVPALVLSYGPWFWVNWLFANLLLFLGSVLYLIALFRFDRLYQMQALLLLFIALTPWVGNALYVSRSGPVPNLDLTPVAFALSGLGMSWNLFRFRLLDIVPIARRRIVDEMREGVIVLDLHHRLVDINQAAKDMLDLQNNQIIGQPISQLLLRWAPLLDYLQTKSSGQAEIVINDDVNNDFYYFDAQISPLLGWRQHLRGTLVMLRDITERKRTEAILREREGQAGKIFQLAPIGLAIATVAGEFLQVNQAYCDLVGYREDELIGQPFSFITHPDDLEENLNLHEILFTEGRSHFQMEKRYLHKNGQTIYVILQVTLVRDSQENPVSFIAQVVNITQRKLAENALAQARDQALEVSELKTQLLAKVSHELRTPLGAILGYTELIEDGTFGPITQQQREAAAEIIDSTKYLTALVSELLDQAQFETGQMTLRMYPIVIREFIGRVETTMNVLAQAKGLTLQSHIEPNVPWMILGDEQRLQQILVNLINNAIKFTENGRVTISCYCSDPTHWVLQIADTGVGIPKDAQAYIFEPFRQVDGSTTRSHTGAGLGLSIVKQLISLMDGEISLHSEPGYGSTFTIQLPLVIAEEKISS